ncbi:hypothetical protein AOC10_01680 [Polynucleobacter asymbioticus]|uniref:hypothetical protein n=1 Tax=Polynucleobacter asymbioticus TaxID=576611 RepID=UPI0008FB9896|nr:hypothetical protein [Polynucleobacter asymbioticus]APC05328.1 hypothetical protein AOC10_01680 [Polynucleobacter asymbioticus]
MSSIDIKPTETPASHTHDFPFYNIVNFLSYTWKKLASASVVGALLGFAFWYALVAYQAEITLNNNGAISLDSWLNLQKSLPNLVLKIQANTRISEQELDMYRQMSDERWWKKNVSPTTSVTRNDIKEMDTQMRADATANNYILNFKMTASGRSKELAMANINSAADFLKKGSSYLVVKSMLHDLQVRVLNRDAQTAKQISDIAVEMQYQNQRLVNLEGQLKRFPSDGKTALPQVVDPKASNAKYMPLTTQIIALNTDIMDNKETVNRLNDGLMQNRVLAQFLEQALPMAENSTDGESLIINLLNFESELRTKLSVEGIKSLNSLHGLRSELTSIQNQFKNGLEQNAPPGVNKPYMVKSIAIGIAAAFFLMLFLLLGRGVWIIIKSDGSN